MEIAISKPALLARREPAMPAHIGYVRPELLSDKNKRKGRTVRLLKTAGMFGLVGLDMLESLRLTASEESFDWNCWCVDGAMKESGRGLKMRNERREWARRRTFMGQCKQNEDFGSGTAASSTGPGNRFLAGRPWKRFKLNIKTFQDLSSEKSCDQI